jgi:hypothetical protein
LSSWTTGGLSRRDQLHGVSWLHALLLLLLKFTAEYTIREVQENHNSEMEQEEASIVRQNIGKSFPQQRTHTTAIEMLQPVFNVV